MICRLVARFHQETNNSTHSVRAGSAFWSSDFMQYWSDLDAASLFIPFWAICQATQVRFCPATRTNNLFLQAALEVSACLLLLKGQGEKFLLGTLRKPRDTPAKRFSQDSTVGEHFQKDSQKPTDPGRDKKQSDTGPADSQDAYSIWLYLFFRHLCFWLTECRIHRLCNCVRFVSLQRYTSMPFTHRSLSLTL